MAHDVNGKSAESEAQRVAWGTKLKHCIVLHYSVSGHMLVWFFYLCVRHCFCVK